VPLEDVDPGARSVSSSSGSGSETAASLPASEGGSLNQRPGSWGAAFLTTFTTVFLAELGDKTQLAALLLSAESGRPGIVFLGSSLALISSSLVGVLLGRWLARVIPADQLERLAGLLMVALGLWLGRQAVVAMVAG
jgi:putative Ca2+/H+ antiporter (TMEM165/GDT1 family)